MPIGRRTHFQSTPLLSTVTPTLHSLHWQLQSSRVTLTTRGGNDNCYVFVFQMRLERRLLRIYKPGSQRQDHVPEIHIRKAMPHHSWTGLSIRIQKICPEIIEQHGCPSSCKAFIESPITSLLCRWPWTLWLSLRNRVTRPTTCSSRLVKLNVEF